MTAARQGVKTALIQDRPVLGGNASTEIRVPPVGAANCNFVYARESRRFEGDHILTVGDIDGQAHFDDAVAYGGWGFDHHPAGGFHDKERPGTHEYLRGPHNVPLRSLYSRNVANLFFAGRNISASHYALSSTRVMLTCAHLVYRTGVVEIELERSPRHRGHSTAL